MKNIKFITLVMGSPVKLIEFIDEVENALGIKTKKENYPLHDGYDFVT